MAQMYYVVTRLGIPPRYIKAVKTDALILAIPARKLAVVKALADHRLDQMHTLRRDYELGSDPTQRFLNAHSEVTPIASSDPVFRFSEVGQPLHGNYKKPERSVQPPAAIPPWRDLTEADSHAAVMNGQSLWVTGAPGTGKTFFVRELVKAIREQGRIVDVITKTHSARVNFGEMAQTADHYVRQKIRTGGGVHCGVLVLEEITMSEAQLWSDTCKLSLADVAFILCGDFAQFPAVCEHWAGCGVPDGALEKSDMVRDLAGSNRLTLTVNKRSDPILFEFYTSLARRTLADALEEARRRFPLTSLPATTLVISHARRRYLNMQRNLKEKPPDAIFFKAPGGTTGGTSPQSMWLWPGLKVVGAGGAVPKGVFESLQTVSEDEVTLHNGTRLTAHQTIRSLRLAYALTYPSCQGLTIRGRVRLDSTESNHFTWKHLYVGSSRCTAHDLLEVV
jgi:hypothetical protein